MISFVIILFYGCGLIRENKIIIFNIIIIKIIYVILIKSYRVFKCSGVFVLKFFVNGEVFWIILLIYFFN